MFPCDSLFPVGYLFLSATGGSFLIVFLFLNACLLSPPHRFYPRHSIRYLVQPKNYMDPSSASLLFYGISLSSWEKASPISFSPLDLRILLDLPNSFFLCEMSVLNSEYPSLLPEAPGMFWKDSAFLFSSIS